MKIIVTGGAGFIGSNLVEALIAEGHSVFIVDNLSTGKRENVPEKTKLFKVDITNKDQLAVVFEKTKPEAVFHLAAQASVNNSVNNPAFDVLVNVIGTINLVELAKKYRVKNFIFSSTGGAIYGDGAKRPTPESAKADPLTPYGMDKLQAEKFINFLSTNTTFKPVILRYSNVYGPRQDPLGEAGVIAIFTAKMLRNEPVEIFGDGEQTRDFVYVDDVVRANLLALDYPRLGVFNIGTAQETSINKICKILKKEIGYTKKIKHSERRSGEQRNSSLSIKRAHLKLGWKPKVGLEEGIKKTVEWMGKKITERV